MKFSVVGLLLLALVAGTGLKLTREQLKEYDGKNGVTYLACGGLIFDVSESDTYGPKGMYGMFAGKDASVPLARMSFDKKYLEMSIEEAELSEGHLKSVESWKEFYLDKYPVVGELIESPKPDL